MNMKFSTVTRSVINLISGYSRASRALGYCTKVTSNSKANVRSESGPSYTAEQQNQILRVLNESSSQELARYDVTRRRAEQLFALRTTIGRFGRLESVLEVKGIGERGLERLCDSILVTIADLDPGGGTFERASVSAEKQVAKRPAVRSALLVPPLDEERKTNLGIAVGIHLGINTVSWASISREKRLLEWDLHDLNFEPKKIHITSLLDSVLELRSLLPSGDAYVFEDAASTNQPAQQQITSLSVQLQKSQLSAMMLALLNTRVDGGGDGSAMANRRRVYYLRSRTPARLFRTLVGSERVSAQATVRDILARDPGAAPHGHYSPVSIDAGHRAMFESRSSVEREKLCHALLLTMAFMDLAVFQTPQSWKAIQGR